MNVFKFFLNKRDESAVVVFRIASSMFLENVKSISSKCNRKITGFIVYFTDSLQKIKIIFSVLLAVNKTEFVSLLSVRWWCSAGIDLTLVVYSVV